MAKKRPMLNLEELRHGQRLEIFKKLQRSPLITVSYNWILRVCQFVPYSKLANK